MRYTWPKFKLCRREGINLFWTNKYDVKKRRSLPGQHGSNMPRLSDYGKLLRNKQVLKRIYMLSEKQFRNLVTKTSSQYAKNNNLSHDKVLYQFLERRADSILLKSGFAKTIMQARQMVSHGHCLLNGKKHNIPSAFLFPWDVLEIKESLKKSPLYIAGTETPKEWRLRVNRNNLTIEVLDFPPTDQINVPVDILKVIEFYARA